MRQKSERHRSAADRTVKDVSRKMRKRNSSEDKRQIVLAGFNGEDSITELCGREGIAQSQFYN
jgi:transposase